MLCPHCRQDNLAEAHFCQVCGHALASGPAAQPDMIKAAGDVTVGQDVVARDKHVATTHNYYYAAPEPVGRLPERVCILPPRRTLIGRDEEIARICEAVRGNQALVVVEGARGLGKASIVVAAAHQLYVSEPFQAALFWSAEYQPCALETFLDYLGRALGHQGDDRQPTYSHPAVARQLLERCPTLLIISRVTQDQHGPILDFLNRSVPHTTRVIVTSPSPLSIGTHIVVRPLDRPAALALIRQRAKALECAPILRMGEPELEQLAAVCDGSPLAIALVIGQFKENRTLNYVLRKLQQGKDKFRSLCLSALDGMPDMTVETLSVICMSREAVTGEALEAVLELSADEFEDDVIRQLTNFALVQIEPADAWEATRLTVAPLVRSHVRAARADAAARDLVLRRRLAQFYWAKAQANGRENWAGHLWLLRNAAELFETFEWFDQEQDWPALVSLMQALYYFLGVQGFWLEKIRYGNRALHAAQQTNDLAAQAQLLIRVLGWTDIQLNRYAEAQQHIREGLKIARELGDQSGQASACRYLGALARRQNDFPAAITFYEEAIAQAAQVEDQGRLSAGIWISYSTLFLKLNRLDECRQYLLKALAVFERLAHTAKIAEVLSRLGDIELSSSRLAEAQAFYEQSEIHARLINRRKTRAYNLLGLARVAAASQDHMAARDYAQQARLMFGNLAIADELREMDRLSEMSAPAAGA